MLNESSLSRILKHLQDDSTFAVISAYNYGLPVKENEKRNSDLKNRIHGLKDRKVGYVELKSKWLNLEGEYEEERSLFINNISKEEALKLGKDFKQETILWKDKDGLVELKPTGQLVRRFTKSMAIDRKDVFSALKKGTQSRLNFTFKEFKIEESNDLKSFNDALNYYDGGPGRNWKVIYEEKS